MSKHHRDDALDGALAVLQWAAGADTPETSLAATEAATEADDGSYEHAFQEWLDHPTQGPPDGPAPHLVRPAIRDLSGDRTDEGERSYERSRLYGGRDA